MAAPIAPTPEEVSGLTQLAGWLRDWWVQLFGTGLLGVMLRSSWRASQWKRDIENTQGRHGEKIAALEAADAARADSHNKLEVAVAALPRRDEVRGMISELREDMRAALQAAGGRG
ncbi:MAG: hypothetical protein ABSF67_20430 [Roseiarcus sp.]|jgi:hypothetical protein